MDAGHLHLHSRPFSQPSRPLFPALQTLYLRLTCLSCGAAVQHADKGGKRARSAQTCQNRLSSMAERALQQSCMSMAQVRSHHTMHNPNPPASHPP